MFPKFPLGKNGLQQSASIYAALMVSCIICGGRSLTPILVREIKFPLQPTKLTKLPSTIKSLNTSSQVQHCIVTLHKMTETSKGYVSLFDLGESKDDVEVDYNSLYMHHYKVKLVITYNSSIIS